jgi:hypothetical protein
LSAPNRGWCVAVGLMTADLKPFEPAQNSGEWHHRGEPSSEATLTRTDIGHNDVARSVIAPLCSLVDHFVRSAAQEHFPDHRWRNLSRMRQCCLLIEGVRHQILGTREPLPQRMAGAVAGEQLVRRGERQRLQNRGVQRLVDGSAAGAGDDQELHSRQNGHRVPACVGGGGPNNLQPLRVVLRPVGNAGNHASA